MYFGTWKALFRAVDDRKTRIEVKWVNPEEHRLQCDAALLAAEEFV
jgi:hypothetical protein